MHEVLVNHLVKLAKEKSVVRRSDHHDMTISVDWDVKNQTKQKTKISLNWSIMFSDYHINWPHDKMGLL